jgi:hypothetical protein
MKTKHHPEQLDGEIYMGNSTPEDASQSSWRTGRLGTLTLNNKGEPCDPQTAREIKPWFIQASEVQASIEAERAANRPWSAERIRTWQPMIDNGTVFADTE